MSTLTDLIAVDWSADLERRAAIASRALTRFAEIGQRSFAQLRSSVSKFGGAIDSLALRYQDNLAKLDAFRKSASAAWDKHGKKVASVAHWAYGEVQKAGNLDKQLNLIRISTHATSEQIKGVEDDLFQLARATALDVDELGSALRGLVDSGMDLPQALASLKELAPAMKVTGAKAEDFRGAMEAGSKAFNIDASGMGVFLDQLVKGSELAKMSQQTFNSVFADVAESAKRAGFDVNETMGLIARVGATQSDPQKVRSQVSSLVSIFADKKLADIVAQKTGIDLYDPATGERRDPLVVASEMSKKYQAQYRTDQEREWALKVAFQDSPEALNAMRILLAGGGVEQIRENAAKTRNAAGTIAGHLDLALDNPIDQVKRFRTVIRELTDYLSRPVNKALTESIKFLLDDMKLSGGEIAGTAAVGAVMGYGVMRGGKALLDKAGGLAGGVATGKLLEEATGVQSVYVVNMPDGGLLGGPNAGTPSKWRIPRIGPNLSTIAGMGAGAQALAAGAVVGAGAAGYAFGTEIYDHAIAGTKGADMIGESIAKALAFFGNDEAERTLRERERAESVIRIEVQGNGKVTEMRPANGTTMAASRGPSMVP